MKYFQLLLKTISFFCIIIFFVSTVKSFQNETIRDSQRTFTIDFLNNVFLKDNQPFQYISGSVFYARIHESYWYDRLSRVKAAGLNTIQFYVPWNYHEYEEGKYNFTGNRDLSRFLTIARELDLLVLLRSGPYICAEWDFGGLPAWLLRKNASMILRSSDSEYLSAVLKWYSVLLPILKPHLYQNNGSIIMVQVENEYGSFYTCDDNYLRTLYDTVRQHLGDDIIIYSTDGNSYGMLSCGSSDRRIFSTVDFGTSGAFHPDSAFSSLKLWQPSGPLVNSEYYSGWLDSWGFRHNTVSSSDVVHGLMTLLNYSKSVSVNMYMFHGGTSFGLWNGANFPPYAPQITSYDYDAPISESGDITPKYLAIRNYLQTLNLNHSLPPIPSNTTKASYGLVVLPQKRDFLTNLFNGNSYLFKYPVTMESLSQYHGYMVYLTNTSNFLPDITSGLLNFTKINDYAYIFTSNYDYTEINYQGKLDRNMKSLTLSVNVYEILFIIMENAGHINYGSGLINDVKGIIGNVTLNGHILYNWQHYSINIEDLNTKSFMKTDGRLTTSVPTQGGLFSSTFNINSQPEDTFLKTTNFSKGIAIINGFNLGRYWNTKGPQYTLFVPKYVLQAGWNELTIFELEGTDCQANCYVEFVDKPYLDGPIHFEK